MGSPKVSLCQLSFPDTSHERDIEIARAVGAGGISIVESKLRAGRSDAQRRGLEEAGLEAALAVPRLLTILPPTGHVFPVHPADPAVRVEELSAAVSLLATVRPAAGIMLCTGPAGDHSQRSARSIVVEGMRTLASTAVAAGTRIAVEPMRESFRPSRTIVSSLAETIDLLDEVGRDDVGIIFDVWHLWDSPRVHEVLQEAAPRVYAVQVADYRAVTRGPMDRVVAGDGIIDLARFFAELRTAGFSGWYDLEVFSDDGRFGSPYEDSLWKLDAEEFARRQMAGFLRCWEAAS